MSKPIDILLVEDNIADAKLFNLLLKEMKFNGQVNWVLDGEVAMDYLLHKGNYSDSPRPDAIVLDINLPKKDGREVLKEVKAHPSLNKIPVFVVTTSNRKEDFIQTKQLGATRFYTKPKDLDGFEVMMRALVTEQFALLKNGPIAAAHKLR